MSTLPVAEILQGLNAVGLPLLGLGMIVLYRALVSRSSMLSKGLNDLKSTYDAVLETMKRRAEELDRRFEDEKRFRGLYLTVVQDSESHKEKIRAWKDDELAMLQERVNKLHLRVQSLETQCDSLVIENRSLQTELDQLRGSHSYLASQNNQLLAELGRKQAHVIS